MLVDTVRVCFRHSDTRLFARVVCWWLRHDAAHCEVAYAWRGDRHDCVSASFMDDGVRGKNIAMPPEKWRVYEMPGDPLEVQAWLDEHDGWKYDTLGLFGFVWRRVKGWLHRVFCSEACADILGLPEPWRYDPALLESVCARLGRRVQ